VSLQLLFFGIESPLVVPGGLADLRSNPGDFDAKGDFNVKDDFNEKDDFNAKDGIDTLNSVTAVIPP